jgi:hypothetical protein
LLKRHTQVHGSGHFALIGVNSDENLERLRPVLISENITWRSFQNGPMDSIDSIAYQWNMIGWPLEFLIDAEGRIPRNTHASQADAIEELLQEIDSNNSK